MALRARWNGFRRGCLDFCRALCPSGRRGARCWLSRGLWNGGALNVWLNLAGNRGRLIGPESDQKYEHDCPKPGADEDVFPELRSLRYRAAGLGLPRRLAGQLRSSFRSHWRLLDFDGRRLILGLDFQHCATTTATDGSSNMAVIGVVQRPVSWAFHRNQGPPRSTEGCYSRHPGFARSGYWGVGNGSRRTRRCARKYSWCTA